MYAFFQIFWSSWKKQACAIYIWSKFLLLPLFSYLLLSCHLVESCLVCCESCVGSCPAVSCILYPPWPLIPAWQLDWCSFSHISKCQVSGSLCRCLISISVILRNFTGTGLSGRHLPANVVFVIPWHSSRFGMRVSKGPKNFHFCKCRKE